MKINLLLLLFLMGLNGLMAQWDKVYPAKNGYSAVLKDKKFGFIDANQKVVIAPKYEMAYDFNSDGLVVVKKDGKFGCIDTKENVIIAFKYDKLFKFVNHVSPYIQGNGTGLIRDDGTLLTKPVYTKIYKQKEGYYLTVNNDKYGFLDLNGTEVIPFIYDKAEGFKGGKAKIIKDGRSGYIDKTGKEFFGYQLGQYLEKEGGIVIQLDASGMHGLVMALENATDDGREKLGSLYDTPYMLDFPHNKLEGWRLPTIKEFESYCKVRRSIEKYVRDQRKVSNDKFRLRDDIWLGDTKNGYHYRYTINNEGLCISWGPTKTGEQYYVRYVREF
jgi:hypothetical protein